MIPVSVVIVTKDEEGNIKDAVESVKKFSEIVVIDSFSTDRTPDICKQYTEKVFQEEWKGYAKQKQSGVDKTSMPWVLILDADERLTQELACEISHIVDDKTLSGFCIPRKNFFLGRWMRHGGWWPDYTLRLFRKDKAFLEEREVHERVVVNGEIGFLKNPMEHYTAKTLTNFLEKLETYAILSAKEMKKGRSRPGIPSMTLRPLFTFVKMFFLRRAFLDGTYGLILSLLYSYYTFLKYAQLWENKYMKG